MTIFDDGSELVSAGWLAEQDATLTALRAEIAAKDKAIHELEEMVSATEEERNDILCAKDREIADLKHDIARHLTIASDAETYGLANRDKEIARLREALRPFAAAAYALEPGDDNGQPFHSSLSVALPEDEHGERVLVAGFPDKTPLIAFGAGWAKVPASLVCGLTLGDFRQAALATATCAPRSGSETESGAPKVDTNPPAGARPGAGDIPEAPPEKI